MKLLIESPDDFRVYEEVKLPENILRLEEVQISKLGSLIDDIKVLLKDMNSSSAYILVVLEKLNVDMMSVVGKLSKLLNLNERSIILPGTKDKRALTRSVIGIEFTLDNLAKIIADIRKLYRRKVKLQRGWFTLSTLIGITTERPKSTMILSNRFEIRVKFSGHSRSVIEAVEFIRNLRLPNYFGHQRFGSVILKGRDLPLFIPCLVLKRRYFEALKILLSEPMVGDTWKVRNFKCEVKKLFRNGKLRYGEVINGLQDLVPKNTIYSSLVSFLEGRIFSETTSKRALDRINERLVKMWVSALQSYIWNEILANSIVRNSSSEKLLKVSIGPWRYPVGPENLSREKWEELVDKVSDDIGDILELPWKKVSYSNSAQEIFKDILENLGIKDLRFQLSKWYTFPSQRRTFIIPENFEYEVINTRDIRFKFSLPRGSYATVVLKFIEAIASSKTLKSVSI